SMHCEASISVVGAASTKATPVGDGATCGSEVGPGEQAVTARSTIHAPRGRATLAMAGTVSRSEAGHALSETGHTRAEAWHARSEVGETRSEVGETRSEVGETRSEFGET